MGIIFDTGEDGFHTVLKDYHEICMRLLWEKGEEGVTSGEAWIHANKLLNEEERTISRASIIMFLNDMVDKDVLRYTQTSGKGGYHKVYYPKMDEEGFKLHVARNVMSKLLETWPDATKEAYRTLVDGS